MVVEPTNPTAPAGDTKIPPDTSTSPGGAATERSMVLPSSAVAETSITTYTHIVCVVEIEVKPVNEETPSAPENPLESVVPNWVSIPE